MMDDRMTMTKKEGAKNLGIGLTNFDRLLRRAVDPIPSLRVGRRVLIPCEEFKAWLSRQVDGQKVS